MTPDYYKTSGTDLYEEFYRQYGCMATSLHLLMEARQYLHRCRDKGQYVSDLKKTKVILERLIQWEENKEL